MNIQFQNGQSYLPSSFYSSAANFSVPQYSPPCACTAGAASSPSSGYRFNLAPEYSTRVSTSAVLPEQTSNSLACTIGQMVIDAVQRSVNYLLDQIMGGRTGSTSTVPGLNLAPTASAATGTSSATGGLWDKIANGAADAFQFVRENWDTIKDVGSVVLSKLPIGGIGGVASGVWNFAKNIFGKLF